MKRDGNEWSSLGTGMHDPVTSLALDDTTLNEAMAGYTIANVVERLILPIVNLHTYFPVPSVRP
jgi:hypothetical protein